MCNTLSQQRAWKDTPASVWKSELSGTLPNWARMQPSRAPLFQSSVQFPGHSQHPWPRKERKDRKSVGFVLTHWHLLMLIWHCLWVLLLSKSSLFSQKRCHLALAAIAQAAEEPETEILIRKKKTNILKHFLHVYYLLKFVNFLWVSSRRKEAARYIGDPGDNSKGKLEKRKNETKRPESSKSESAYWWK